MKTDTDVLISLHFIMSIHFSLLIFITLEIAIYMYHWLKGTHKYYLSFKGYADTLRESIPTLPCISYDIAVINFTYLYERYVVTCIE